MGKTVDFRPSQATAGSFWDGVEAVIVSAAWEMDDFGGRIDNSPVLHLVLSDGEDERDERYTAGSADFFVASDDGERLEALGTKVQLNRQCNAIKFLTSLVAGGYPEDKFDLEHISSLNGLKFRCVQQPTGKLRDDGQPKTVLMVDKVVALPGEGKSGSSAGKKASGKKSPAPAPDTDTGLDEETQGVLTALLQVIADEDGNAEIAKSGIIAATRKEKLFEGVSNRAKVMKRIVEDDFLSSMAEAGGWDYADGIVTLL